MDTKKQAINESAVSCDQRIGDDFPLEDIMKEYFCGEDLQSFYSDVFDIGDAFDDFIFPNEVADDGNAAELNPDFLVPDLISLDDFCQQYDDAEPEEQLFSLLGEYIQEKEIKGEAEETTIAAAPFEVACSSTSPVSSPGNQPGVTREQTKTKAQGKRHHNSKNSQQPSPAEQTAGKRKKMRKVMF